MKNNHNIYHYVALFILLGAGFVFFFNANGFPRQQFAITVAASFFYVVWGVVHHYLKGDLHTRIVIEYSLIALLAVFLIRGAVIR